jgi:UDP-N-acetyl-D-mannosaminuronate dehydrogenase
LVWDTLACPRLLSSVKKYEILGFDIITAGTDKAPSIIVAEASKAIENAQRDVNISFVNELALISIEWELTLPIYWKLQEQN